MDTERNVRYIERLELAGGSVIANCLLIDCYGFDHCSKPMSEEEEQEWWAQSETPYKERDDE